MTRTIRACPNCDSHEVSQRKHTDPRSNPLDDKDWRCKTCKSSFDQPVVREKQSGGGISPEKQLARFGGEA